MALTTEMGDKEKVKIGIRRKRAPRSIDLLDSVFSLLWSTLLEGQKLERFEPKALARGLLRFPELAGVALLVLLCSRRA